MSGRNCLRTAIGAIVLCALLAPAIACFAALTCGPHQCCQKPQSDQVSQAEILPCCVVQSANAAPAAVSTAASHHHSAVAAPEAAGTPQILAAPLAGRPLALDHHPPGPHPSSVLRI